MSLKKFLKKKKYPKEVKEMLINTIDEYIESGLSEEEADRLAVREFGEELQKYQRNLRRAKKD